MLIRSELLMSTLRDKNFKIGNGWMFKVDARVICRVYRELKRSGDWWEKMSDIKA